MTFSRRLLGGIGFEAVGLACWFVCCSDGIVGSRDCEASSDNVALESRVDACDLLVNTAMPIDGRASVSTDAVLRSYCSSTFDGLPGKNGAGV
jgi:hypothetical protein